jgi:hypothetical protein
MRGIDLAVAVRPVGRSLLRALTCALPAVLLLAACQGSAPSVQPPSSPPAAPALGNGVSVRGAQLLLRGRPFVPRGVQIVGLVAPNGDLQARDALAHHHFGQSELRTAISYHVNTIRFQVSQFGLDPKDPLYSRAYVAEVIHAVRLARRLGLEAIVAVQAEAPAGRPGRCPLPTEATLRVWNELAPVFKSDHGVMFELYNEPAVAATPAGWQVWRDGGTIIGPTGACTAIGMQALINAIRADGAGNVIIIPGADFEHSIAGMPVLTDPASRPDPQLAYGIHDPPLTASELAWQHRFGAASARVPVIVTEWNGSSSAVGCVATTPWQAPALLDYLGARHIGIVGYAFDLPGTLVSGWSGTPTTYSRFACGTVGSGPGHLLFSRFALAAAGRS